MLLMLQAGLSRIRRSSSDLPGSINVSSPTSLAQPSTRIRSTCFGSAWLGPIAKPWNRISGYEVGTSPSWLGMPPAVAAVLSSAVIDAWMAALAVGGRYGLGVNTPVVAPE